MNNTNAEKYILSVEPSQSLQTEHIHVTIRSVNN